GIGSTISTPARSPVPRQGFGFRAPQHHSPGYCRYRHTPTPPPQTKAIDGQVDGDESLYSYFFGDENGELNQQDSAEHTMIAVVTNPYFDWGHDRPPQHGYHDSIIYEAHVRGMTMRHPEISEESRGS